MERDCYMEIGGRCIPINIHSHIYNHYKGLDDPRRVATNIPDVQNCILEKT